MSDITLNILNVLRQYESPGVDFEVPSPVFRALGMRYVDYRTGKNLVCAVPAQTRFANPLGMMQGGIITAAFDAAFGSLSHLLARRPCETITMTASFVEPIPAAEGGELAVEVWIRAKSRRLLFLEGRALNLEGKTVATASSSMSVYRSRE